MDTPQNFSSPEEQTNLARERTLLAAERTLLAYWRTALAFGGAGLLIIKFIFSSAAFFIGSVFFIFSFALFLYGIRRHFSIKKRLPQVRRQVSQNK